MFPYKVSVVIPVYNKEKYISQCLDSLMNQTLSRDSFEILCINDGSTDRSADIIKKHISTAKNIKLFNQENKGVSSARNKGILQASGKYILFLDADDRISNNTLADIVTFFDEVENEVDLVTYNIFYENKGKLTKGKRGDHLKQNCVIDISREYDIAQTTMNICIKNNKKQLFDESLNIYEDQLFITSILQDKSKIGWCNTAKYIYNRDGSDTRILNYPLYSYTQLIYYYKNLLKIGSINSDMDCYCKTLILYNMSWRLKGDYLFPYHITDGKESFDEDMQYILNNIDNNLIVKTKWLLPEHKTYLLSLKQEKRVFPIIKNNAWWLCDTNGDLLEEKKIGLVIERERINGTTLQLIGFLKSSLFSFTDKPTLWMYVNKQKISVDLYESANSCFNTKIKTNIFWGFEIKHPIQPGDSITFKVCIDEKIFDINFWFRQWNNINSVTKNFIHFSSPVSVEYSNGRLLCHAYDDIRNKHINKLKALRKKSFGRYCLYILAKSVKKFSIWLYSDSINVFDNAYLQFKHDIKKKDGIWRFYIYSGDKEELRKYFSLWERFFCIKHKSLFHRILFIASHKILTSYGGTTPFIPYTKAFAIYNDIINFETIYLQHGVMHADCAYLYAKDRSPFIDRIIASTHFETKYFKEVLHFKQNDIIPSCMPRFSTLKVSEPEKRNTVLFAPSWRLYLVRRAKDGFKWEATDSFTESDFYKETAAFLTDPALPSLLRRNNIRLDIKLHPNFYMYKELLRPKSDLIEMKDQVSPGDYSCLITDFSSFQFDFIYLEIPVIYFIPDAIQIQSGLHSYRKLIHPPQDTGPVTHTATELLAALERTLSNPSASKAPDLFLPHKKDICENIYQHVMRLEK